ncbi:MAG: GHMP family kinase ATP-binding protein, partial [Armatimonadota bacterium]
MTERADFMYFMQLLNGPARGFWEGGVCTIARAPGRLDVMGGVADYSGGVVLEGTLAEAAFAAVCRRSDGRIRLWSWGVEDADIHPHFETSLNRFYAGDRLVTYDEARAHFAENPRTHWAAYAAGALYVLLAEGVVDRLPGGADVFIYSTVPIGAGVSSSAAIEVASMAALAAAYGVDLEGLQLARLCQIVENRVAGAPCGIMDQVTSALGRENELLALLCQPHEVLGTHRLPAGCHLLAIDSGVKHSVGGSRYTRARTAAFMGLAI